MPLKSIACRSGRADRLVRAALEHLVHETVLASGFGALEVVALGVVGDGLERLAGVLGEDLVQALAKRQDLAGVDVDVGRLALRAAGPVVAAFL